MDRLLATKNRHKVQELGQYLGKFGIRIRSLHDFPEIGEIEETGDTLAANALIKARTGFKQTGLPTIADDTGLEVAALDGAPGIYAARYAGPEADFDANIDKLLAALRDVPEGARQAEFHTAELFGDANQ